MTTITNKDQFLAEIEDAESLSDESIRDLIMVISQDGFNRIVKKTPVDTGRARASWNVNQLIIDESVKPPAPNNRSNYYSPATFNLKILGNPYTTVYISNALPYIWKLEHGGYTNPGQLRKVKGTKNTFQAKTTSQGFSVQAPQGMVSITVAELKGKYSIIR